MTGIEFNFDFKKHKNDWNNDWSYEQDYSLENNIWFCIIKEDKAVPFRLKKEELDYKVFINKLENVFKDDSKFFFMYEDYQMDITQDSVKFVASYYLEFKEPIKIFVQKKI